MNIKTSIIRNIENPTLRWGAHFKELRHTEGQTQSKIDRIMLKNKGKKLGQIEDRYTLNYE